MKHFFKLSFTSRTFLLSLSFTLIRNFSDAASADWKLSWSDEFDGKAINWDKWNFEFGDGCHISKDLCGWGNHELQWYTNTSDNVFIANGHLVIQARRENSRERPYTSARMITLGKGDWQFGRIEIRAKFPYGKGILPLIWMLPSYNTYGIWPSSGEIDIAAMLDADEGNKIACKAYVGTFYNDLKIDDAATITKPAGELKYSDDFHVFALERDLDSMTWYINDKKFHSYGPDTAAPYTYPFNDRFHLVLSLAVGGLSGRPDNTPFPKRLEIDYVRFYVK